MAATTARHLTRRFGDRAAVDEVTFDVARGGIVALVRRRPRDLAAQSDDAVGVAPMRAGMTWMSNSSISPASRNEAIDDPPRCLHDIITDAVAT